MTNYINIIGFLILLYTAYLIITEKSGNKGDDSDAVDNAEQAAENIPNESTKPKPKKKKSAPVQTIEDDADVLRQGRTYNEQLSNEEPNVISQSQQHFESEPEQQVSSNQQVEEPAPSTKNQETPQPTIEMVSIKCPYCDSQVLVPKGGSAECECCSSRLNDTGGLVE